MDEFDFKRGLEERPKSRRGTVIYDSISNCSRMFSRPTTPFPSCPKTTASLLSEKISNHNPERLVSQKGISFLRTSTSHGHINRAIRDKRYFEGMIQLKIGEINSELFKMKMEMEKSTREQQAIGIYEKRVKQLATDLTELQKNLSEYNTCIDKINTGYDSTMILCSAKDLSSINDSDVLSLETMYTERIKKQESIKILQEQIDKGMKNFENVEKNMNQNEKNQYSNVKKQRDLYTSKVINLECEIDHLNKTKKSLVSQVFISQEKKEQIRYEIKLYELEKAKERILDDIKINLSPEEKKKEFLNRVKEDKAQTLAIQKATKDIKDQIKESEIVFTQSESNKQNKIIDLKIKEKGIEDFLSSVDKMTYNENEKLSKLKNQIHNLLYQICTKIAFVPTPADYKLLSSNHKYIKKTPSKEYIESNRYLQKITVMKANIESSIQKMKNKINKMASEIDVFSDLVSLEEELDTKRVWLMKEKAEICSERPMTKSIWQDTLNCFNDTQKALAENENYIALSNCEKKLALVEESNFSIEEYLNDVFCDEDLSIWESKSLDIVKRLNEQMINKLNSN